MKTTIQVAFLANILLFLYQLSWLGKSNLAWSLLVIVGSLLVILYHLMGEE